MPKKTVVENESIVQARKRLGETLKARRLALGYSQTEIASTGVIERTTLSKIESGARTYSVDYLLILSELYTKLESETAKTN